MVLKWILLSINACLIEGKLPTASSEVYLVDSKCDTSKIKKTKQRTQQKPVSETKKQTTNSSLKENICTPVEYCPNYCY